MRKIFEGSGIYWPTPDQIIGKVPLPFGQSPLNLIGSFENALNSATDEIPLQRLFEENPELLLPLVSQHTTWVFPRVALQNPLGGGLEPDFMICDWTSNGPEWSIVELESPKAKTTTAKGLSAICNHAAEQIKEYRRFMRTRAESLKAAGLPGTDQVTKNWIIIGRREETMSARHRALLTDLRADDIEVSSYDRILDQYRSLAKMRHGQSINRDEWLKKNPRLPN